MSRQILVVDDEPNDVELFRLAARESGLGYPILAAIDGEEALTFLLERKLSPAAVFLDLNMPGIGGLETLRRMKTSSLLSDLLVIVLSSSDLEQDQASVVSLGCELYFVKPKTFASYLEMMERIKALLAAVEND